MQNSSVTRHLDADGELHDLAHNETGKSAVSWSAILGGAFVAAAATIALILLGSGLGLATMVPLSNNGVSAAKISLLGVIWLIITQWISSGLGGYITGRLRTKWAGVHSHEVFFRDTAHGLLTWSVAAVIGVMLIGSTAGSMIGGASKLAAGAMGGAAAGAGAQAVQNGPSGRSSFSVDDYMLDSLFRTTPANSNPGSTGISSVGALPAVGTTPSLQDTRTEVVHILTTDLRGDAVPDGDRTYLAQLVASRTGLSQADAQARVDNVLAQMQDAKQKAKQAADTARKATAKLAVMTFLAMLIGAFIASAAAALGGIERDTSPYPMERDLRNPRM